MTETIVAWIKDEDIKAVRGEDGVERLVIDGRKVSLADAPYSPTQWIIGYAQSGKRARKRMRAHFAGMVEEG